MKRVCSFILAAALLFTLVACSFSPDADSPAVQDGISASSESTRNVQQSHTNLLIAYAPEKSGRVAEAAATLQGVLGGDLLKLK